MVNLETICPICGNHQPFTIIDGDFNAKCNFCGLIFKVLQSCEEEE